MFKVDPSRLLKFADLIPGHSLRHVKDLPGYNTWGVEIRPEGRPDTLLIGENGREFGMECWPFMAAHEALHSMATFFLDGSDYHYLLYNICEDWRMNRFLIGTLGGDLEQSYHAMRAVILKRWEQNPIILRSPVSQFLQHLCYMNHLTQKKPTQEVQTGYMAEVLAIRDQFGHSRNWPLPERKADVAPYNQKVCQKLIALIRSHRPPPKLNTGELRQLIQRMGYDLSFRLQRDPKTIEEVGAPRPSTVQDSAPLAEAPPVPMLLNTETAQKDKPQSEKQPDWVE